MRTVAIIPARGGSTRIPRKNIKLFHGKPIIAYSIELALKSGLFNEGVIVSTEDPEIGHIGKSYGASWLERPREYAHDAVGTQMVMQRTLRDLETARGIKVDLACCIYATAPLLHRGELHFGRELIMDGKRPYAYTVHQWRDAGQCYWGWAEAFITGVPLDHWATAHHEVGAERYCDINTPEDWQRAEMLYAALKAKGEV